MDEPAETYADKLFSFTLPKRHVRGRLVRMDAVLEEILAAHDYPPAIRNLLAEAIVLAALMGGLTKHEASQLTMQAQTEGGIITLLVCDYRGGELRGYVQFDQHRLAGLGANPSLFALFGKGYLAITFDVPGGQGRYQGIVPLEGESLSEACEAYFVQSEQVPTRLVTAIRSGAGGTTAAGLLVQHLPEGEEGRARLHVELDNPDWEHVAILAASLRHDELLDANLSMDALAWRLFHEEGEIRVQPTRDLVRGCRCTKEHYEHVIARFPPEDQADMRNEAGEILVDCAFCSRIFTIVT